MIVDTDDRRHVGELESGYPVDLERVEQDLHLAQKAVVIHQPEDWPAGRYCRNERAPWPCRLYRWGHQVLWLAGWREADVADLLAKAARGVVPW